MQKKEGRVNPVMCSSRRRCKFLSPQQLQKHWRGDTHREEFHPFSASQWVFIVSVGLCRACRGDTHTQAVNKKVLPPSVHHIFQNLSRSHVFTEPESDLQAYSVYCHKRQKTLVIFLLVDRVSGPNRMKLYWPTHREEMFTDCLSEGVGNWSNI